MVALFFLAAPSIAGYLSFTPHLFGSTFPLICGCEPQVISRFSLAIFYMTTGLHALLLV